MGNIQNCLVKAEDVIGLKLNHLTKKYGQLAAVDNLSLEIPNGRMFGLLGGNGAGKTTTFRMVLGLLSPTGGTITWNDEPINYDTSHLVGYLPEERGLYPKLKVRDQLIYLGRLRGMNKQDIIDKMHVWLERFRSFGYRTVRHAVAGTDAAKHQHCWPGGLVRECAGARSGGSPATGCRASATALRKPGAG